MAFTPEELEAMRLADEEIEEDFELSQEDFAFSNELDRQARFDRLDNSEKQALSRQREHRQANKERRAAIQKAYYEANKDKISAYKKNYYKANRDSCLAYQKAYEATHRERRAAYQKAYREANKEKLREYQREYRKPMRMVVKTNVQQRKGHRQED